MYIYIYIYIYRDTHTHIYIYVCIFSPFCYYNRDISCKYSFFFYPSVCSLGHSFLHLFFPNKIF